jgi:hypothetical protein
MQKMNMTSYGLQIKYDRWKGKSKNKAIEMVLIKQEDRKERVSKI